jgi:uncharacterized protein (TIGR02646 family)
MNYIKKNSEPVSLKEYKKTPGVLFKDLDKAETQTSLLDEQKALCAYCMSRISTEWNNSANKPRIEIEHYRSQDVYNGQNGYLDLRLDYNNMLGVCNGHEGEPNFKLHCDKSKDLPKNKVKLPLTINPLIQSSVNLLNFKSDGRIESSDKNISNDICTLNLNTEILTDNRKKVIDVVIEILNAKSGNSNTWSKSDVIKEITNWSSPVKGKLREYNQVAINFLTKKLPKII